MRVSILAAGFALCAPGLASAQDAATAIRIVSNETCGQTYGTNYELRVNGNLVGSYGLRGGCTCSNGGPQVVATINDPAVLAQLGGPGCSTLSVRTTNQVYVSAVRVEVDRPQSGTESICLFSQDGNCDNEQADVCGSGGNWVGAVTWNSAAADADADGICDGDDADSDGDGFPNADDNCPTAPNPEQADSDDNGVGDACQPVLASVPWLGNPAQPHQVYSGGRLILQAAAYHPLTGAPVGLVAGSWDPGDGSGPQAIDVANSRALALEHVYHGAEGQPFTATVRVTDTAGQTYTDTFKVVIAPDTLDVRVNMTIDRGLWNLHTRAARTTADGQPAMYWSENSVYYNAATASTLQAFQINGHRPNGNPLEDPYVLDARLGLTWLFNHLQVRDVSALQAGESADSNGNGIGLGPTADHEAYIAGQLIDAVVASGLPDAVANAGDDTYVQGRRYRDIVRDMLDLYHWGMSDLSGGGAWNYNWYNNSGERRDSSASHWWAIGVLAAETWGIDAPAWVKNRNLAAIPTWQLAPNGTTNDNCRCGYDSTNPIWDGGTNVTPACLLMLEADDVPQNDVRFTCSERWMNNNFNAGMGNIYTMFQTAKAMRLARNGAGNTAAITLMAGARDWYTQYASWLVDPNNMNQTAANGTWRPVGTAGGSVRGDLRTAWGVIILSPTVFELGPRAHCTADPLIDGTAALGGNVTFDGAGSTHDDPEGEIVSYSWNFRDGGTADGQTANHAFNNIGIYNVTLTVTDSAGLSDSTTCPVDVRDSNIPPNANAGGPYTFCLGDTVTLNGATSSDLDTHITAWAWDLTAPIGDGNFDAHGATVDATAFFPAVGTYDIGLRVTDDDGSACPDCRNNTNQEFTTVTIVPADHPSCNRPPVALCQDVTVAADATCAAAASVNNGSSDPDGDALTISQSPAGPYALGVTEVTLTVGDGRATDTCEAEVRVEDRTPPSLTCPAAVVAECATAAATPVALGDATVTDNCPGANPASSDAPASYPLGTTTVTYTTSDATGLISTCTTDVTVRDTIAPVVDCNTFDITPPDAPIGFVATVNDACGASVTVDPDSVRCWKVKKNGEIVDKGDSCVVTVDGALVTIEDAGGVDDNIAWTAIAVDAGGNTTRVECSIHVGHPGGGNGGGGKANCGVGNGVDGDTPGCPGGANDGPANAPGNPGRKGGK